MGASCAPGVNSRSSVTATMSWPIRSSCSSIRTRTRSPAGSIVFCRSSGTLIRLSAISLGSRNDTARTPARRMVKSSRIVSSIVRSVTRTFVIVSHCTSGVRRFNRSVPE